MFIYERVILTSSWQAGTGAPVLTCHPLAGVRIDHTATAHLADRGHLAVPVPPAIQRQLVPIQHNLSQAALETVQRQSGPVSTALGHPGPEDQRAVAARRPQGHRGLNATPALHVAVVQRDEGVILGEIQRHRVPQTIVN